MLAGIALDIIQLESIEVGQWWQEGPSLNWQYLDTFSGETGWSSPASWHTATFIKVPQPLNLHHLHHQLQHPPLPRSDDGLYSNEACWHDPVQYINKCYSLSQSGNKNIQIRTRNRLKQVFHTFIIYNFNGILSFFKTDSTEKVLSSFPDRLLPSIKVQVQCLNLTQCWLYNL